jgi:hypothetical protein
VFDRNAPAGPTELSIGSRLLYEIVAFCCVTESMNAALLMTLHQCAFHERVRETAHALLIDEVQHAKFGWAYLAHVRNQQHDVGFLAQHLGDMIGASASENLTDLSRLCQSWSDPARGYLSRGTRIGIFARCLEDVIFPGLEMHGVATHCARHWLDAQTWYDERAVV